MITSGQPWDLHGDFGHQMPYIDDCNSVGTTMNGVKEAIRRIIHSLGKFGLPISPKKTRFAVPSAPPAIALGL